ncbi:MAG: hypothetical protein AMXMBFR7_31870 [Planctomycetota bacterium]
MAEHVSHRRLTGTVWAWACLAAGVCCGVQGGTDQPEAPAAERYRIEREESGQARLNGQEVAYLRRIPNRTQMTVRIAPLDAAAGGGEARWGLAVEDFSRSQKRPAGEETLRFDRSRYDHRLGGRAERMLEGAASPAAAEELKRLTGEPWYVWTAQGGTIAQLEVTAHGLAWPLADHLALGREWLMLAPNFPPGAETGTAFERVVVLPYPVPVSPALTTVLQCRATGLDREGGRGIVEVVFSGQLQTRQAKGFAWGGIRLADVQIQGLLSGRVRLTGAPHRLLDASVDLQTRLETLRGQDSFAGEWKLKSSWKPARE